MPDDLKSLWNAADAYERYMGRWSRKIAPLFLEWLDAPPEKSWVDIGCGTGGLTSQIADHCTPSHLVGVDPSEGFIALATDSLRSAEFQVGNADDLIIADDSMDFAVSGLLLNFVPDPQLAIMEMVRTVRPGGTVALYVWDYAGQMQIMRYFFDTARQFDSSSSEYDDGVNAPICRPKRLLEAFESTGLVDVETTALDTTTPFVSFSDYWTPFLGGTGSAPRYLASLDESMQNRIRDAVRAKLPTGPGGEILLAARAWAVKGVVLPQ